ncbi:MAG: methyltransferase domain-containing protein [Chloroflexales bacterium]|nr:methyltransferase domain-containing protein [Chloroflexales bacterium]
MTPQQAQQHTTQQTFAAIFDRAAATYDQVGPPFFAHFGRQLVELARLAPGEIVLDIATGRGAALFPASQAVGLSGHVTGIDLAPAMIAATQADAIARGSANITLQPMDAAALAFDDATFDAVLCGFAVFFLPDPLAALREWQRVLKPGGRLALSTWSSPFGPEFQWLELLQRTVLPLPAAPACSGAEPSVFDTPEGLTALLARAGFTAVAVSVETARFVYADEETWWASLWSHGMRGWLEAVEREREVEALQRFKEAVFAQLRAGRQPDGVPQTSSALLGRATRAAVGEQLP